MDQKVIRVAVGQFNDLTDEKLRFAAQIGVKGIQVNAPKIPGETRWEERDLQELVRKTEAYGLTLEAIENVPIHFYDKVLLGLPGRDEQLENYCLTLRNMGRAGIPILGFHFMPNSVWRTEKSAPGRGGAACTSFDMAEAERTSDVVAIRKFLPTTIGRQESMSIFTGPENIVDEERMWDNYTYFIKAVLPTAEAAGVKLALHPDDPPMPMLGGVARIFRDPAGFQRAHALNPGSPSWGLDLCLGTCSSMIGGSDTVREMIEFFGPKGCIFYVHFRDVKGTVPNFTECFIGEGNYDPAEAMMLLRNNGFTGFLLDDHVPHMDGDSDWNHRGRAHAIGYMQGLLRMGGFLQRAGLKELICLTALQLLHSFMGEMHKFRFELDRVGHHQFSLIDRPLQRSVLGARSRP